MEKYYSKIFYRYKKVYTLLGFFFLFSIGISGQNPTLVDSLEMVYLSDNFEAQDRLELLRQLAEEHDDPQKMLTYSLELIELAEVLDSVNYLFKGFLQKGQAYRLKSDLTNALKSYFEAVKIAVDENKNGDLGIVNIAIADVYSIMENHDNAIRYYHHAISLLKKENDSINIASALNNLGDEYLTSYKPDSALIIFEESGKIFRALNHEIGTAYTDGNMGIAYAQQGRDSLAMMYINKAVSVLEEEKEYYPISVYFTYMSDIYINQNDWNTALSYSKRSLELAHRYGLKDQISDANLQISELYEQTGNTDESFKYYKNYTIYKDSVRNITSVQQMANIRTDFEIAQKQTEVDLLERDSEILQLKEKRQKNIIYGSALVIVLIFLLAVGLFRRYNFIKNTNIIIEEEKNRSENLLLNILPEETAMELKQSGRVQAKKFESVTVLFTDFQGFTKYSEDLSPEKLVESVDFYYSKFDEIMEKYNLEKIKTVGDAYMCAGGLPVPTEDHPYKMMDAAIEIAEFVRLSKKSKTMDQMRFDIRIGINTGPVVAGVVGNKKFAYDIWGDTVNIASRMESNSETGKINISEKTYNLIKDVFACEYRGEIKVKNKGLMKMYFVNNRKLIL